jgi:hypothetical protein
VKNAGRAEAARVLPLADCAEVLPGFSVRGRMEHHPNGTHQLIITRNLTDGMPYTYEPAHELRIVPHTHPGLYEVRPGDVLFMSRGEKNRAWVIERAYEPSIAPVSFYILRPRHGLDGGYLAWYLNQQPAQAAIDKMRTGAGTPLVQREAFKGLELVVPVLTDQQERIAGLGILFARERQLRKRLAEAAERAHAVLGANIIATLRNHHG